MKHPVLRITLLVPSLILLAQSARADQALVFTVKTHKEKRGQQVQKLQTPPKPHIPGEPEEKPVIEDSVGEQTIILGPDYFVVDNGDHKEIFDFSKKEEVVLNAKKKTYGKLDLHALACFRVMECQNRKFMQHIEQIAKIDTPDDFDNQSLFGIDEPGSKEKLQAEIRTNGDTTSFFFKDKERASYVPSQSNIDEPLKKTYQRVIAQVMKVHPSIRKYLAEHKVPARLSFHYRNEIFEQGTVTYELKESKEVAAPDRSVPAGYTTSHSSDLKSIYDALDKLGGKRTLPDREKVAAAAAAAGEKKNYLEAFLTLLEYGLSCGDKMTPEVRKIKDGMNSDEDCQKYLGCLGASTLIKHQMKVAISNAESIDRSKLTKGYIIDIALGNAYESIGEVSKARQLLTSALEHNPLITGVYHDLGMIYVQSYRMDTAWECFRIGQSICPTTGQMQEINAMDKRLEDDFPELF